MQKSYVYQYEKGSIENAELTPVEPIDLSALKNCIYKRKSVRKYLSKPVEPELIDKIINFVL